MNEKDIVSKTYFKVGISTLIGAILGIIAYTNNWLG
ncbi:hypothetical protein CLOACE_08400 [Clostridium acetireducens DSM 10703]|uniref:Uncharacterized protein n=1 Tax=Clostridium acetireducens DSM 10703 TaxID=1121290 RepID=A0A1E8EZX1_9CLOT|nr:hypothetical protein CLOACE_08400 [Clostridium acetireducens DSM 10703]